MDTNEFRKQGYEFIDWLAGYFENIENLPVKPSVSPGDIKRLIPGSPPLEGESMDEIFRDFREKIMPGITHWQHPGWMAYFPANNSPASVLAELLTAGLGAQCMIWQTSPAAAELEEIVMEWLRQMIGLPETFTGVIQDTASTATLCALLSAREKKTGFDSNRKGLTQKLRVYGTSETHSSIEKGVKIAGIGKENLHLVETLQDFSMNAEALRKAIEADLDAGFTPCCVVATLGSTSSMAMDHVAEIASVCIAHGIWLHVDAAFAGTAAVVPELRGFMDGVEMADSFVFNPHKWMMTNFDCSAYYVKDTAALLQTFSIHPEYLKTDADMQVRNYRDWGIQLGRRFRALKLWFVIRSYGVEGIRAMVREHVRIAKQLSQLMEADCRFEILAPVSLSLVCFRFNPGNLDEGQLDLLNRKLLERINASGEVFLTHTSLNGKYTIRVAIGSRTTTEKHVQRAWEIIRSRAAELVHLVN
ncbi:MAG TPA: aminotransferase class I/II-fold pyridoxal phosphate-dependent enzyme [Bacteroidales bacterium]|nr:aminotransferase class I/II-fold pyridoxal phosphate-dependent enzyme [Bacteroidales bacterium]